MRKFKGQINGVEYTNQEDFEKAYRELVDSGTLPTSVSYTIEETSETSSDAKTDTPQKTESECGTEQLIQGLDRDESEALCRTIDLISEEVERSSKKVECTIDRDDLSMSETNALSTVLNSSIQKIRWVVNRLPAKVRRILCESVYDATKEMVENINSELKDRSYEEEKERTDLVERRYDVEQDMKDIEDEIGELEKEFDEAAEEYDNLGSQIDYSENRLDSINKSVKFFENLIEVFEI